jgi:phosphatidylserine/phosphatidylglycerophosphate/cardiolipin synthase-like enzyme
MRPVLPLIALLLIPWPASAEPAIAPPVEIHYSPVEKLDLIDVEMIDNARTSIDMAAYVLNDRNVIAALNNAQARGVKVRVLLDPHEPSAVELMDGLELRVKRPGPLQHLKSYVIDGAMLRTGSANFSHSGETQQDNDVVIIRDAALARIFEEHFETIWTAGE